MYTLTAALGKRPFISCRPGQSLLRLSGRSAGVCWKQVLHWNPQIVHINRCRWACTVCVCVHARCQYPVTTPALCMWPLACMAKDASLTSIPKSPSVLNASPRLV